MKFLILILSMVSLTIAISNYNNSKVEKTDSIKKIKMLDQGLILAHKNMGDSSRILLFDGSRILIDHPNQFVPDIKRGTRAIKIDGTIYFVRHQKITFSTGD